jgi:predicted transcriptional regulator
MGAPIQAIVSDAELEVLKMLWLHAPATARGVAQHLKRRHKQWAYTTILTLLSHPRSVKRAARKKDTLINQ